MSQKVTLNTIFAKCCHDHCQLLIDDFDGDCMIGMMVLAIDAVFVIILMRTVMKMIIMTVAK